MDICGIYCVIQLEVWRDGAGGPNKTAIKRYVTFTDVVAANMRKRDGPDVVASFFWKYYLERDYESPQG